MASRIRFFNRRGIPLEEIVATTKRSWLLNKTGDCTFQMSRRDDKLIKSVVANGNIVLITNPDTKPWVGVLDTPRAWMRKGPVFTAYQADIIFQYQEDQLVDPASNVIRLPITLKGTAGSIFEQIINRGNEYDDTLIRVGEVHKGGVDRQETLNSNYLSHVRAIAERAANDFDVTPEVQANNTLLLRGNWYAQKGSVKDITLEEGVNIECQDEIANEQGTIVNSVMGIGSGATAGTRIGALSQDALSMLQFGPRRGSATFSSVKDVATLIDNTLSHVKKYGWPRMTSRVNIVDKSLFKEVDEGDIVSLILHNAGFLDDEVVGTRTPSRISGLQAIDENGTMECLIDEFKGND